MKKYFPFLDKKEEEEEQYCPTLSFKTRLYCFLVCFLIGIALSVLSWLVLISPRSNKLRTFSVLFTLGSVISIAGSMFLKGPVSQVKSMLKRSRWLATLVYVAAIVMTLVSALVLKNTALTLVFLIVQIVAYCWYVLTYIPCGVRIVKNCFRGVLECCE